MVSNISEKIYYLLTPRISDSDLILKGTEDEPTLRISRCNHVTLLVTLILIHDVQNCERTVSTKFVTVTPKYQCKRHLSIFSFNTNFLLLKISESDGTCFLKQLDQYCEAEKLRTNSKIIFCRKTAESGRE